MYGLCAVLFSLALNHKQMSLFYAPAFFCFLLGSAMAQPTTRGKVREGSAAHASSAL